MLFLGISISKFVKIKVKSSINNYFSKGIAQDSNNFDIQSSIPENETTYSEINNASGSDSFTPLEPIYTNNKESSSKSCTHISSQQLDNSNAKNNDTSAGDMRNIKTMFAQMRNASNSCTSYLSSAENVDRKIEKVKKNKNQLNMNSFFSKKLEIISPTKKQLNDPLSAIVQTASTSSTSFFSKKLEVISPSKNVQNDDKVELSNQSPDGFFSRKLETVSPSKCQITNHDSVSIIQSPVTEVSADSAPTMLLCERCNNTIHIDEYEEHTDHHVAMELSKSLNETDIIQPLSNEKHKPIKTYENGKKRKINSKNFSKQKKPCSDISSFFKPVLNP